MVVWGVGLSGGWGRVGGKPRRTIPTAPLAVYQQKYLILPTGKPWLEPLILGVPHPQQHMVLLSIIKVQIFIENYRDSEMGMDASFLPLILFPAMFLVLSEKPFDEICKHFEVIYTVFTQLFVCPRLFPLLRLTVFLAWTESQFLYRQEWSGPLIVYTVTLAQGTSAALGKRMGLGKGPDMWTSWFW